MKRILAIIFTFTLFYNLTACAPVIVAGTVAGAGATVVSDRRSPDKMLEDQAIEIQATDYIYSHKDFGKKVHVSVTSFNGTVLISGETPNQNIKDQIVKKVSLLRGVKKVIDVVSVKANIPVSTRTNDMWITSKVKSNIIVNKGLITRTKVVTSDSKVYLLGLVDNKEAKQIVGIVKKVDGIKSVVPLFQAKTGSLDKNLSASSHIVKAKRQKPNKPKQTNASIESEDEITVSPYVLQPSIQLNTNE